MPKVRIYAKCLKDSEKQALISLLKEAGFEAVFIEDEAEIEEEYELSAPAMAPDSTEPIVSVEDALIVLITSACVADNSFKKAVTTASKKGCRVIGVWPPDEKVETVPPPLEDYGYDVISWNAQKVRQAVQGPPAQWETPAGTPRAEPVTKRNRC
jgi:hypothetical protein